MMTYRREETGRRMSYLFSCAAFAGAFGGLIGFGLVRIETGNIVGWQWLYIVGLLSLLHLFSSLVADNQVEGAITLALAPIAYFWIPNRLDQAWFLNSEEKQLAAKRYEINKRHYNEAETFQWGEVWKAFKDWRVSNKILEEMGSRTDCFKVYTSGTIQFCADITLYGISTFMPQIIRSMGFSNVNAQILTVPGELMGLWIALLHMS